MAFAAADAMFDDEKAIKLSEMSGELITDAATAVDKKPQKLSKKDGKKIIEVKAIVKTRAEILPVKISNKMRIKAICWHLKPVSNYQKQIAIKNAAICAKYVVNHPTFLPIATLF